MPLAEKALIAQVRRMAGKGTRSIRTGIGDDCAVLRVSAGHEILVTTDFSLEDVHFRRKWHPAESVGWRCLARGLSDIAAMGGEPVAAFLSLALPRALPQSWVRGFMGGLLDLAKRYHVQLAGGDTAESPERILADIIVVGTVPQGKAILRSGARPGDAIFVSGALGGSSAAIKAMRVSQKRVNPRRYPRHFHPEPRIEIGRILRQRRLASSLIDLSDGLSTDLAHVCAESGVGAEIVSSCIPQARVGTPTREVGLELALRGGEDYELLFTAPSGQSVPSQIAGVTITEIGRITLSRELRIVDSAGVAHELRPCGWEHFRKRQPH